MTSITLTELNQNPSRATRLADHGEVIVMRRGHAAYRITKIESSGDPLDELVATGLARPARSITAVMVTHNLRHAVAYGDRLTMLHAGCVVMDLAGEKKQTARVDDLLSTFYENSIEKGN